MKRFAGFDSNTFALLTELPQRDKVWFQNNRAAYEASIAIPSKAFVTELGAALRDSVSAKIVALPRANGSIAPINNDVRFSKDKTAYRDHLLFRFWEGADKKTAATLFIRLSTTGVGFASGIAFGDIKRWRKAVDDETHGGALAKLIKQLARGRDLDIAGRELKRVPAPYADTHPRADFLRHKMFQVRWSEPLPASVGSAAFVDWCARRLLQLADTHHWLVRHT